MELWLWGMRIVLAAVFGLAGGAKLAGRATTVQAMVDFGVPARWARPLGMALPPVEIGVAIALLLPGQIAWWGAAAGLALLLSFTLAISVNLAQGRKPACACFGELRAQPIGRATLARNGVLALLATLLVVLGQQRTLPGVPALLGALATQNALLILAGLILVTSLALLGWMVVNLLRQNGRLLLRVEALERHLGLAHGVEPVPQPGLPLSAPAPAFRLPDGTGVHVSLDTLLARNKPVLLVFLSATCAPCVELLPEVARWQRTHQRRLTIVPVGRGDALRTAAAEQGVADLLLQPDDRHDLDLGAAYGVEGTPSAVLIRTNGTIGSALAGGVVAVRDLVERAIQPPDPLRARLAPVPNGHGHHGHGRQIQAEATGPGLGEMAPEFRLPALDGQMVATADLRGQPTLVLFWNPDCSFCRRMLPDLQAWAAQHAAALRLLVVSRGSVQANRALGLPATVVLDEDFRAGTAYGARGTPAAILIGADGRIASGVQAGASQILDFLHNTPAPA